MFPVVVYFQVPKEWRAVVLAWLLSASSNCQFAIKLSSKGEMCSQCCLMVFLFYILNIWAFFSLFLSPSLAPFFLSPSSFPAPPVSSWLCMLMEGHSSTANTNLQLFFIATVVSWVWKQKNQIARKPGKSVSGKSGEQVCGSVHSCFLPLLIINDCKWCIFIS